MYGCGNVEEEARIAGTGEMRGDRRWVHACNCCCVILAPGGSLGLFLRSVEGTVRVEAAARAVVVEILGKSRLRKWRGSDRTAITFRTFGFVEYVKIIDEFGRILAYFLRIYSYWVSDQNISMFLCHLAHVLLSVLLILSSLLVGNLTSPSALSSSTNRLRGPSEVSGLVRHLQDSHRR
jgi:hypothetical protein